MSAPLQLTAEEVAEKLLTEGTKELDFAPESQPRPLQAFRPVGTLRDALARTGGLKWAVKQVIPEDSTVLLHGPPKSGKSAVSLDLIACLIRGEGDMFADRYTVPTARNVCYLYGEGAPGVIQRLKALNRKRGFEDQEQRRLMLFEAVPQLFVQPVDPYNPVSGDTFVQDFRAGYADWLTGGVLVIDTYARATVGANSNDQQDTSIIYATIARIRDGLGCSVIVIHHSKKGATDDAIGDVRGSGDIAASFDVILATAKDGNGRRFYGEGKEIEALPTLEYTLESDEWQEEDPETNEPITIRSFTVNWTGQRSDRADASAGWRQRLVEGLRTLGATETAPVPVAALVNIVNASKPAVQKHLRAMADDPQSAVAVIMRRVIRGNGKEGIETEHFYLS